MQNVGRTWNVACEQIFSNFHNILKGVYIP